MAELLRSLVEWAREQELSPWIAVWLAAGWVLLRFLSAIGSLVSRTAGGLFSHYGSLVQALEKQIEEAKLENIRLKTDIIEREEHIARLLVLVEAKRDEIDRLNADNGPP